MLSFRMHTYKIQLFVVGLFMTSSAVATQEANNDDLKLKNLERLCPECSLVVSDLLELRVKHCLLKDISFPMIKDIIDKDSMYSFLLAVHTGRDAKIYEEVKAAASTNIDCESSHNWIKLIQQEIKGDKV